MHIRIIGEQQLTIGDDDVGEGAIIACLYIIRINCLYIL